MMAFARLLDSLVYTGGRNAKLRLMADYFTHAPDPDRGYALAALTGGLDFPNAKPALIRDLAARRVDPVLFAMSYDYVGDLAETVALIWPERPQPAAHVPELGEIVEALRLTPKDGVAGLLEGWLDSLDATGRWALLKLITGGLRVGVSARLAKTAVAEWGGRDAAEIEEVWHGLKPPYAGLFAWAEGLADRPAVEDGATFRPFMLATPLEERDLAGLDPADFAAEWKWDGIRVQVAARGGTRRLFARSGDDVGGAFPDILEAATFDAVIDGELLVVAPDGEPASFNHLQQRLNRKTVTPKMLRDYPAHVRVYDMLFCEGEDLRPLPFAERRARLERWFARPRPRLDLSPLLPFESWDQLAALRDAARQNGIEGLMLKRKDSPYLSGRPKGPWFKWKRDALTVDAVLMYAQRGHGKRSSYYSDYTFGAWSGGALVPVGKAYFGFTDEELLQIDRWVRANTVNRFGPVREVRPGLVFEVAFDSVHASGRHKSGVALRFPRIARIRWDKPAAEADRLEALEALIS
ncbi:MAG: cisplatin damage response ATP-dependent DNA ligase [Rhodospirillales bacterium]|nr:cisplatin damage response ATP-dependent DNA ligase [Rhodospirillales bacterium]